MSWSGGDEGELDDIDLDKVVWDPRYRREVIDRLNRKPPGETGKPPAPSGTGDLERCERAG